MNIIPFPDKSAASKARVSALADRVKAAEAERQRCEERDYKLRCMSQELGPVIQKAYGLLGIVDAEKLITWLQSAKREEFKLKQRIRGE